MTDSSDITRSNILVVDDEREHAQVMCEAKFLLVRCACGFIAVFVALGCLLPGLAVARQTTQATVVAELRARERAVDSCLANSVIRMRRTTVEKDDAGVEQTTVNLRECNRAPNRVRVVGAELHRDQPETWDFDTLDWTSFRVIWSMMVSPDIALTLTRSKGPDDDEFIGLRMDDIVSRPDARRYDVQLDDSLLIRSISLLDQWKLFSELIEEGEHVRFGEDEKEIAGVKCRTASLVEPTREHTFWIDAADRSLIRRLEIYRKADDESFGHPLWRTMLSADELEGQQHPDAADLSVWSRTVIDLSEFKDIGGGALLPGVAEFEMTSMNRDGQTKIVRLKIEIVSLKVLDEPLPPSAFELSAPDGTPVRCSPDNDKPKLIWRAGRVVPAESSATTATEEKK